MAIVYAKVSAGIGLDGGVVHIRKGEAFSDTDPVVQAKPGMFTADPPVRGGRRPPKVERATRAPGETRKGRGAKGGK